MGGERGVSFTVPLSMSGNIEMKNELGTWDNYQVNSIPLKSALFLSCLHARFCTICEWCPNSVGVQMPDVLYISVSLCMSENRWVYNR